MLRIFTIACTLTALGAVLVGGSTAAVDKKKPKAKPFPEVIQLPTGFRPEGIEVGKGHTFYTGSVANGAIYRGDLRTGKGTVVIPGATGKAATGIELGNRNRLWVAGAGTGTGTVYDLRTKQVVKAFNFAAPPTTFINDVVLTKDAAYFTDSMKPVLYKVPIGPGGAIGDFQTITLSGDYVHAAGFNLNGIDATRDGKTLVAVQTAGGKLYRIDAATGAAKLITLAGGATLPNGDGILLTGKTLYVVQNQSNKVAVIALDLAAATGRVVTELTNPNLSVPTTIDDFGKRLYAVNARFGVANPDTQPFQVVQLRQPKGN